MTSSGSCTFEGCTTASMLIGAKSSVSFPVKVDRVQGENTSELKVCDSGRRLFEPREIPLHMIRLASTHSATRSVTSKEFSSDKNFWSFVLSFVNQSLNLFTVWSQDLRVTLT